MRLPKSSLQCRSKIAVRDALLPLKFFATLRVHTFLMGRLSCGSSRSFSKLMRLFRLVGLSGSKAFLKAKSTSRFAYGLVSPGLTRQSLKDLRAFIFHSFRLHAIKGGALVIFLCARKTTIYTFVHYNINYGMAVVKRS